MMKYFYLLCFLAFSTLGWSQSFYDVNKVVDVHLTFAETNWEAILDSLKLNKTDSRLIGKVTLDGITYDSVGVRYKGNSSFHNVEKSGSSKLPFNIKANTIKKGQRFQDTIKTIKLSNVFRDPSFVREVLAYKIVGTYMPAPKANFARLYINGKYIGFYNNTSSVDNDFLDQHFGDHDGTLVKCDPSWNVKVGRKCPKGEKASLLYQGKDTTCYYANYEMKSDYGWKELQDLTYTLNKNTGAVEKILNVDRTLWMHAFNNVLVNLDSYAGRLCHNYYLYRDSSGVFQPIPWDMNLAFGGFRYDGNGGKLDDEGLQKLSPFLHYQHPKRPLISKLLGIPLYRKIYIAHLKTILEDFFFNDKYKTEAVNIQRLIDRYVQEDDNKLYDYNAFRESINTTTDANGEKIIGIVELMEPRINYLKNHPLLKKESPVITNVKHEQEGSRLMVSVEVKDCKKVYLAYKNSAGSTFKGIEMLDNGKEGEGIAGDSIYGISLPYEKGIKYYIVAEAEKTASLSPARAAMEFHIVK